MSKRFEEKIGTELYAQILKAGVKAEEFDLLEGFVPRARLNEQTGKATALQSKVESYEQQITETSKMLKGSEELKGQFDQLQEKYKADLANKDKEITNIYKKSMMKETLVKEGAKHPDLLMNQINFDSLSVDNGNLLGGTDIVNKLKTDYSDLFIVKTAEGNRPAGSTGKPASAGSDDEWGALAKTLI